MQEYHLSSAEFAYLLHHVGVATPIGVEPGELPGLTVGQDNNVLQGGLDTLQQTGIIVTEGAATTITAPLNDLIGAVAQPHAVVHAGRSTPGGASQLTWWYVSAPTIAQLSVEEGDIYRLAQVASLGEVLDEIERMLPLEPVPQNAHIAVTVIEKDQLDLMEMRRAVERIPAQQVLESSGLDAETARAFFDDLVAPLWTGAVTFVAVKANQVVNTRTIRMLQGEDSWILHQDASDSATATLETVTPGAFRVLLNAHWTAVA